jgi:hypothetical protein
MIESPLIQELVTETTLQTMRRAIVRILLGRFGTLPAELEAELRIVTNEKQLDELLSYSVQCPDLAAFRAKLVS